MKKLLSVRYSEWAFNLAMLSLRLVLGLIMLFANGLDKLQNFSKLQGDFYNFMHLGPKTSLILVIFAELFCSVFVVLGLFTRFSVIPLVIAMAVVIFGYNAGKPWGESQTAFAYLAGYFTLLLCGPGKISIDGMISK